MKYLKRKKYRIIFLITLQSFYFPENPEKEFEKGLKDLGNKNRTIV
jgi:hypothetical protein